MMKNIGLICSVIFMVFVSRVYADNSSMNLQIPSTPQTYSYDSIRAGNLDCKNAIGSASTFEFGVMGVIDSENQYDAFNQDWRFDRTNDVGVYAKVTIPLNGPKERINCNTLYQLELQKKRLEVQKLQAELNELRRLQFEN
jgi:hypothetical protein